MSSSYTAAFETLQPQIADLALRWRGRCLPAKSEDPAKSAGDDASPLFSISTARAVVAATVYGLMINGSALDSLRPQFAPPPTPTLTHLATLRELLYRTVAASLPPADAVVALERLNSLIDAIGETLTQERIHALEAVALVDPLTGVGNRRAFDRALQQHAASAMRYAESLSLVSIDLDGLKQLNDTAGHEAGDNALRALSRAVQHSARTEDSLFRLGGDEFVVLLPKATSGEAHRMLDRVTATAPPFSYGIASMPRDTTDPQALLGLSDRRLLEAKRTRPHRDGGSHPPTTGGSTRRSLWPGAIAATSVSAMAIVAVADVRGTELLPVPAKVLWVSTFGVAAGFAGVHAARGAASSSSRTTMFRTVAAGSAALALAAGVVTGGALHINEASIDRRVAITAPPKPSAATQPTGHPATSPTTEVVAGGDGAAPATEATPQAAVTGPVASTSHPTTIGAPIAVKRPQLVVAPAAAAVPPASIATPPTTTPAPTPTTAKSAPLTARQTSMLPQSITTTTPEDAPAAPDQPFSSLTPAEKRAVLAERRLHRLATRRHGHVDASTPPASGATNNTDS